MSVGAFEAYKITTLPQKHAEIYVYFYRFIPPLERFFILEFEPRLVPREPLDVPGTRWITDEIQCFS